MTHEVAGDDTGIAPEDRLRRELTDQLLRDLCTAERGANPRDAALFAVAEVCTFVQRLAGLERDLGRFPHPAPDGVLFRLAQALAGLEAGTVDPLLAPAEERRSCTVDAEAGVRRGMRPGLPPHDLAGRATAAAAMEILMLAGRTRKDAAREVVKILRGRPILAGVKGEPWRAVARWREEIRELSEKRETPDLIGQDVDFRTRAAGQFNFLVGEARRLQQAGAMPAQLVRIAHVQLDHGVGMGKAGNPGLARAKSERSEG